MAVRKTKKSTVQMPEVRKRRRKKFTTFSGKGREDAFYETAEEKYAAERGEASRTFTDLATGILPKRIYPVKVTGYRAGGKYGMSAIALYKSKDAPADQPVQVLIPYDRYSTLTDEELAIHRIKSRQVYLKNQMGSIIDIIPVSFDRTPEGEVFFIGSRIDAMKKKARDYWFAYEAGTQHYRFNEGSLIAARILEVYEKGIRVEIFGVEAAIPREELSHVWIENAANHFIKGDVVLASIKTLERKEGKTDDGFEISYTASVKDAQKDPHEVAASLIRSGDRALGTIVRKVEREGGNGYVLVRPFDRTIDVYCPFPGEYDENFPFSKGSEVEIKYDQPKLDSGGRWRINGHMKHLVKY